MAHDPKTIEPKWQAYWDQHATFRVTIDPGKPKFYVLDMFAGPSGAGLHPTGWDIAIPGRPVNFVVTV